MINRIKKYKYDINNYDFNENNQITYNKYLSLIKSELFM